MEEAKWIIPLYKIYTDDEDVSLITKIIKRGNKWALGQEIEEFENEYVVVVITIKDIKNRIICLFIYKFTS